MAISKDKSERVKGYSNVLIAKNSRPQKRVIVGIPMTGTLRSEWVMARYGQVIPCNWSQNDFVQWVDQYSPLRFMVADARNIIAKHAVEEGFEWMVFIDHDVILPHLFLVTINDYMIEGKTPVFGGLYFTKSVPSEPLIYRGRGNGYFAKWKMGDKVWVDGMGLGCHVIHSSILKALYDNSEEYTVAGEAVRKVFETPTRIFYDPETQTFNTQTGTEDLEFYSRIMREGIFEKAGWPGFTKKRYPYLCDTSLFCYHIDEAGQKYPARGEQSRFIKQ